MFDHIRSDFRRCGPTGPTRLFAWLTSPAMWTVLVYRFTRWVRLTFPRPIRWLLLPVTLPLRMFFETMTHVQIPFAAEVGPGLLLPHLGTIVINSKSKLGSNCTICHNVTIGHAGGRRHAANATPILGDRVYVGPGAIIIGPIEIGDDAVIGAGSVVIRSVPARAIVVGNPGRVIANSGSFDLIEYPGMENDPRRAASLAGAAQRGSVPAV